MTMTTNAHADGQASRGSGHRPIVVITGASAGVGRATARAFARRGARIGLVARGRDRLDAAAREVAALGGEALVGPLDVADAGAVDGFADRVESTLGPIDVWVNNAMTSVFSPVHRMTADEFLRVTEVTYLGQVYGTLAALRRMRPRDRGAIVQVGSALAYRGIPLQAAYCAAKHAVQGFCDSLRAELLHDRSHVAVSMVQLSAMNTPQFDWVRSRLPRRAQPVPPLYQPEIAAEAILLAADTGRREICVGMPAAATIAGNKIAPGLGDRYLARHGYRAQQTDEPELPNRPDNLFAPVEGDWAARGRFDARARDWSWQLWASRYRGVVWTCAAGLAGLAGWAAWTRSQEHLSARHLAPRDASE